MSDAQSVSKKPEKIPFTWWRCNNCGRTTMSASCGCPNPEPVAIGEGLFQPPSEEDLAAWGLLEA